MRIARLRASLGMIAVVALAGCATGSGQVPSAPAVSAAPTSAASTLPAAALQSMLDDRRETYGAHGAVAAIEIGEARLLLTSGTADAAGTPLTNDARFRIASNTKPIVAALVLDAVARGELALDDKVADYLPGLIRAKPAITVRQILDHTSGVFDEGNEGDVTADIEKIADAKLRAEARDLAKRYAAGERVIGSDRMIVALAETHERYNLPGRGYHYSNPNYQIAAMVLAKATGQTLAELLATRIVEPLGLERTTVAPPDLSSPEMRGYQADANGKRQDVTDDLVAFGNGGNGGIISTADELLSVLHAIVAGGLLPADLTTQMKMPSFGTYGLGLATYRFTCGTFYGHEGSVSGTRSVAVVRDDGQAGAVIALNANTASEPGLPTVAERMLCSNIPH